MNRYRVSVESRCAHGGSILYSWFEFIANDRREAAELGALEISKSNLYEPKKAWVVLTDDVEAFTLTPRRSHEAVPA